MEPVAFTLPFAGLISGTVLGFVARRNFFCTLSALEQHWYGNNSAGVRTWALSAAVAIVLTQALVLTGSFDPQTSFYLTPQFGWLGAIIGGLCFGFGMALVGTCGFGALVRLGGGSLKSLMAVLVLGFTALSTQRGLLAFVREEINSLVPMDFSFAGNQSLPAIFSALAGTDLSLPVTGVILAGLFFWIFRDPGFRGNRSAILTGAIVGLVVTAGWAATTAMAAVSFDPVQIESASFVAPIADALMQFGIVTGAAPDYGVGLVFGVIFGSAIAARLADDVRWEACDDARELSRHIAGAALMGFGGILALGCTIGQGISAASVLAVSVPVVMASILLGARMGLSYLLEGSILAGIRPQQT